MTPPPSVGSVAYENDFKVLLDYQETRGDEECKLSRSQPHPEYRDMFEKSGPLTSDEAHAAQELIEKVMNLSERIASYHKGKFKRPRPFNVDERIRPCTFKPSGATSYPSSHASSALAGACILAEIYPAKAQEIMEYGHYLGELRVITGVHHPSDVKAGQDLALDLCQTLLQNDEFKADLENILN